MPVCRASVSFVNTLWYIQFTSLHWCFSTYMGCILAGPLSRSTGESAGGGEECRRRFQRDHVGLCRKTCVRQNVIFLNVSSFDNKFKVLSKKFFLNADISNKSSRRRCGYQQCPRLLRDSRKSTRSSVDTRFPLGLVAIFLCILNACLESQL